MFDRCRRVSASIAKENYLLTPLAVVLGAEIQFYLYLSCISLVSGSLVGPFIGRPIRFPPVRLRDTPIPEYSLTTWLCPGITSSVPMIPGEKPHRCSKCGRGFKQLTHLNYHLRTHSDDKPFNCKVCGKGFNQKGNLQAHILGHTGYPIDLAE